MSSVYEQCNHGFVWLCVYVSVENIFQIYVCNTMLCIERYISIGSSNSRSSSINQHAAPSISNPQRIRKIVMYVVAFISFVFLSSFIIRLGFCFFFFFSTSYSSSSSSPSPSPSLLLLLLFCFVKMTLHDAIRAPLLGKRWYTIDM